MPGPMPWTPPAADLATVAATRERLGVRPDIEALASAALAEVVMRAPADPYALAEALGLAFLGPPAEHECSRVCAGALVGERIYVCPRTPDHHFSAAHEIGHWLARRAGIEPLDRHGCDDARRLSEDQADLLACALLDEARHERQGPMMLRPIPGRRGEDQCKPRPHTTPSP